MGYIEPAKYWYDMVKSKSIMVYDEVKQPTIDVTNHYKNIATKFVTENYEVVYARLEKEYKKLSKQLKEKLNELKERAEQTYDEFLNKYGDMTWEEIGDKAYNYGEEKIEIS